MTPAVRAARGIRRQTLVVCLAAVLTALLWAGTATSAPPRVTVIGDSVQAAFGFSPQARTRLGAGIDLRMEARVCRRLTVASCSGGGQGTPESALALVRRLGSSLGPVVVVNVGYNDDPGTYDIDAMLGALRAAGVRSVVWVTLRQQRSPYATINATIRDRAAHRPWMRVADWNAAGTGRPWFAGDGLHLSAAGASGLAELLRREVGEGLASIGISIDGRPTTRATRETMLARAGATIAGDRQTLWIAEGRTLSARDGDSGRRVGPRARLADGEMLIADGARAWIGRAGGGVAPLSFRTGATIGVTLETSTRARHLARAGDRLWVATRCDEDAHPCTPAGGLEAVAFGSGEVTALTTRHPISALAAAGRALWSVPVPTASRRLLELRDARTGRVRRTLRLPGAPRSLTATQNAAWVVDGDGRLMRASIRGPVRRVMADVLAVISDGHGQLWVLRADRRTLMRLDPADGRPRVIAHAARTLSGRRMSLTGHRLWVGAERGRAVVSVALVAGAAG